MTYKSMIGIEGEFPVIGNNGWFVDARSMLSDRRNYDSEGNKGVIAFPEGDVAQVEVVSDPHTTIEGLATGYKRRLDSLLSLSREYGVLPIPGSNNGAGKVIINSDYPRLEAYKQLFGEKEVVELLSASGTHYHLDRFPDENPLGERLDQFRLLTAHSPLVAISSSSPVNYVGENSMYCHRRRIIRDFGGTNSPLAGGIKDYPTTLEQLSSQAEEVYERWKQAAIDSGMEVERFEELFPKGSVGYFPVRDRPNFGKNGTWEFRVLDTMPFDLAMACAAVLKGSNDRLYREKPAVQVASSFGDYSFSEREIVLPTHETLLALEESAVQSGITDDQIRNYLTSLVSYSQEGLPDVDKKYLDPIKELLGGERTGLPDDIMQQLYAMGHVEGDRVSKEHAARMNLYLTNRMFQ